MPSHPTGPDGASASPAGATAEPGRFPGGDAEASAGYVAAVEAAFLEHAGRGLMISGADVALAEQWARAGMPVEVVLAGLATAFGRPGVEGRRVRGLSFARRAVEAEFRGYQARRVGAAVAVPPPSASTAPAASHEGRAWARARQAATRAASGATEAPEREVLELLGRRLAGAASPGEAPAALWAWAEDILWDRLPPDRRAALEAALDERLAGERRRTEPAHFAVTRAAHLHRSLRQLLRLPDPADLNLD